MKRIDCTTRVWWRPLVIAFSLSYVGLLGCDECKTDSDCSDDEICAKGSCRAAEEDAGSAASESTDGDSEPAESDRETEPGEDSASDAPPPDAGDTIEAGADGSPCTDDEDCDSGHCQNGICCDEGYCCGTPGDNSDCPERTCEASFCDGNFHCQYNLLPCGALDQASDTPCSGDSRCDGEGGCVAAEPCVSVAYGGSGSYECIDGNIVESCRESCSSNAHCNEGYACVDTACAVRMANGEVGCDANLDCESGHCDPSSAICCESGSCCIRDGDCGRYACDATSFSCLTSCADMDGADSDARCSAAADNHCDNGWCYDDLANGEVWCDEDSDCRSDHCDLLKGICCEGDACCVSDDDCGGMACLVDDGYVCAPSCAEGGEDSDALCAAGFACVDGGCVSGTLRNGDACETDLECASGHCDNGYCCASGECCASAEDCTADRLCDTASCLGSKQCRYYPLACASFDLTEGETCTGDQRCDGNGGCVALSACEGGYIGDTFECAPGSVTYDCKATCADDGDCVESYHCVQDACVPDLLSGESQCDANTDCASGNCNEATGVCCDDGYCCDDNSQCGDFLLICDPATDACLTACTDADDCADFGDYHCDAGLCTADLLNGERFCFEDTDCLSEHCEVSTGVCCDAGDCCLSDSECGGFLCGEAFSCLDDCAGDNELCAAGYSCDQTVCLPRKPNGSECLVAGDCASGYCDSVSGICCEGGDCCADSSDCDLGGECSVDLCTSGFQCQTSDAPEGVSCSDGDFCNGPERCFGGVCTEGTAPCTNSTFCMLESCDEGADECVYTPRNQGEACTGALFCLGDVAKVCTASGVCADPGTGTPPCAGATGDPCTLLACDEDNDRCNELAAVDGTPCDDDPCNGDNRCLDGECQDADELPCEDGDPCTDDACTDDNGTAVCGAHTTKQNGDPCDGAPCMGEAATCELGVCVPAEVRPCVDGSLCTMDVCYEMVSGIQCEQQPMAPVAATCGKTAMTQDHFESSEYYDYEGSCGVSLDGVEGVISVAVDAAGSLTVAVSEVTPAMDIEVLHLTDWCDASTCTDHGTNTLTVSVQPGTHFLVLEVPVALTPESLEVTVTCP